MRSLHLLLAILIGAFWCSFALAAADAVPAEDAIDRTTLISALVVLGSAIVRFAIVVVRPNAAKLGKWGVLILALLSVAAGVLEHLAGGGDIISAIAVGVSLIGGGVGGGALARPVVNAQRAKRIKNGSISLH